MLNLFSYSLGEVFFLWVGDWGWLLSLQRGVHCWDTCILAIYITGRLEAATGIWSKFEKLNFSKHILKKGDGAPLVL